MYKKIGPPDEGGTGPAHSNQAKEKNQFMVKIISCNNTAQFNWKYKLDKA